MNALVAIVCLAAGQDKPKLPPFEEVWSEPPVKVGLRKQLFADDFIVSQWRNVQRQAGRATKENGGNPLLVADKPWEHLTVFGACVSALHDGEKFRLWYFANVAYAYGYAESKDGLTWTKPPLGLYDFDPAKLKNELKIDFARTDYRGKDNNLVGDFGNGFTVLLDAHESDPTHRYKAIYGAAIHGTSKYRGATLAHSADGLRWTPYNEGRPCVAPADDTVNQIVWDEDAKLYRLYTRHDFGEAGGPREYRGNRHETNPDLRENPTGWKTVRGWEFDREGPHERRRRQIMALTNWIHEGVHFAIIGVYEWPIWPSNGAASGITPPLPDANKRHERDVIDSYFAVSRDGDRWDLRWVYEGKPFFERGAAGSWDKGYHLFSPTGITWNDRHWFYYGAFDSGNFDTPRKSGIGLATLRLDGMFYLEPWVREDAGWVITKPFALEGTKLELNADAREGEVRVEVLPADGDVALFGSRAIQGADGVRLPVTWASDLAGLKGKTIRLRFHLRNARLYAFQIRP